MLISASMPNPKSSGYDVKHQANINDETDRYDDFNDHWWVSGIKSVMNGLEAGTRAVVKVLEPVIIPFHEHVRPKIEAVMEWHKEEDHFGMGAFGTKVGQIVEDLDQNGYLDWLSYG